MSGPISPEPVREWRSDYLPAYVSNGLVGLRVGAVPPLGGMAVVNGPTGGEPVTWCRRPVTMPEGWDGVRVERLWVRGRAANLTAVHGQDHAELDFR